MQKLLIAAVSMLAIVPAWSQQRVRPVDLGVLNTPLGTESVRWYTTWSSGLAEAQRSNRPIFFFAAAAQCSNISGTF
ncbi:hypothetical protein [Rubritalea marina]|uniref:hypothetical protein n=1 Tax=Rubritalea marina TaxID=361055 RepID=UPI0003714296|nr:hypothetical protein [Rubritalea marina]